MGRLILAAVLFGATWLLPPAATLAHDGHPAGTRLVVTQEVGAYPITATVEPPPAGSGSLIVGLVTTGAPAAATLSLSAVPFGSAVGGAWQATLPLPAGGFPETTVPLTVAAAGDWELVVRVEGAAPGGEARVPFTVAPPAPQPADRLLRGGLATLGLSLLAAVTAVGLGPRSWLPSWLPWVIGPGIALGLGLTAVGGVQRATAPASAASAAPMVAARPHVNALLRTEPAAPRVGQPTVIELDLSDGATGRPVDDLVPHHEALVHGILIADDGGSFTHLHPARVAPGRFQAMVTPDRAGSFTFYAEVARRDGGTQLLARPLAVAGPPPDPAPPPPAPAGRLELGEIEIEGFPSTTTVRAGEPVTFGFRVLDSTTGAPVPALDPWLGMAGHLIVLGADGALLGHLHATSSPVSPTATATDVPSRPSGVGEALGLAPEAAPAPAASGPDLSFGYTFPAAGQYRLWLQVKVAGEVRTLPLALDVLPEG